MARRLRQGLLPRLLMGLFGARLLLPIQLCCELTDAVERVDPPEASAHHPTAHEHATAECTGLPRAGHCGSESEDHPCHGGDDTCACSLRSVAVIEVSPSPRPPVVKYVTSDYADDQAAVVTDAADTMTRAGPEPWHPPRPALLRTPDCPRAPPSFA